MTRGCATTARTRTRANTTISYYTKGAVIGFLLDLEDPQGHQQRPFARRPHERRPTRATRARRASRRRSSARWPPRWQEATCRRGFARRSTTTDELAYDDLGWLGLRFRPEPAIDQGLGGPDDGDAGRDAAQRQRPAGRGAGAPGHAGLRRGRERRGRDCRDWRLSRAPRSVGGAAGGLQARRQGAVPGGAPRAVGDARASRPPPSRLGTWRLEPDPAASDAAKARLAGWLKP